VADRLSVRWYLGYDLHEPLPDHSTLTRIRERYGLEVFRLFFERIVQMCVEAGLVWGEELFFDSTTVKASASTESVLARLAVVEGVEEHLGELFEDSPQDTDTRPDVEHEDALPSPDAVLPTSGDQALRTSNLDWRDWISENGRPDRSVRRGRYRRMSDGLLSRTDPDATHTGHTPEPPPASATTPTTSSMEGRHASSSPLSSCPPTSRTTCRCSSCSGGPASDGGCVPTTSRATPSTAA
jgi:hypothetical protein